MYEQLQKNFRELRLYARQLTDLKDTRIRHENRIYGSVCFGLDEPLGKTHPDYLEELHYDDTIALSLIDFDHEDEDERKRIRKSMKAMGVYGLLCSLKRQQRKTQLRRCCVVAQGQR